jgi:hypothetical protein
MRPSPFKLKSYAFKLAYGLDERGKPLFETSRSPGSHELRLFELEL